MEEEVFIMCKILVADDDKNIAELISDSLIDEGFEVTCVYNGNDAIKKVSENGDFELIILDIMMPGTNGLSVCKTIRDNFEGTILFVTAKSRTLDTMLGLEMGGDDYIAKPFVIEELVSRVKAHIRRDKRHQYGKQENSVINIGELTINKDSFEVFKNGNNIEVSTREFQLLSYLVDNKGRVLTREQIFDNVWGIDYNDIGTVTVHIKNLRDKLDDTNRYIKTIWGVGYKFVEPLGGNHEYKK
jgi:DNA-binding response OmpR family regulator